MKLSIGIVGLPNVGKSTLFNLITKNKVKVANYPFATIDPNVGIVEVPDKRLNRLTELNGSRNKIPAVVEFYDIAGLVRGANKGEGLGNQFLHHIRETNAIVHVVRCFKGDDIIHIDNTVDPIRDIQTINTELKLKDLDTLQKRIDSLSREAKSGDKRVVKNLENAKAVFDILNNEDIIPDELLNEATIKELNLLSTKSQIYVLNGNESNVSDEIINHITQSHNDYIIINLADPKDKDINELIKKSYKILDLISFFTSGEKETRAWTIKNGTKAPQAAGVIHTDFEKSFIRMEVINWEKLLNDEGWVNAQRKGDIKVEGKEYVIRDGDVVVVMSG